MKLIFEYSIDSELTRVEYSLGKKDFYTEYGYKVYLPKGIRLGSNPSDIDITQITKELDNETVKTGKNEISTGWNKHSNEIIALFKELSVNLPEVMNIRLTKYGVGGSFHPPNSVIINVNYQNNFKNFIHELIHCTTHEEVVDKYSLDHQQKEGLVDWVFINSQVLRGIFPDYRLQNISKLPTKDFLKTIHWDKITK